MSGSLLLALILLLPFITAVGVVATGRDPNRRETVTVVSGVLLFLLVAALTASVSWDAAPRLVLAEPVQGLALALSPEPLGILFALSSLFTGVGAFIGPRLALMMGTKIRAVVFTQWLSLIFMLLLGFSPYFYLAALAFLIRSALMNMSVPLYDAFSMEQIQEREQATVVSVKETAWQLGWTFGPYISGIVQETHGFSPLFIVTSALYAISTLITWVFFRDSEAPPVLQPEAAADQ